MKKIFSSVLVGLLILTVIMLGGCSSKKEKPTADSILEQVSANMEKVKSVSGDFALDMAMKISESGMSMSLDFGMDCDLEVTKEPEQAMHMLGQMKVSLLGLSMDVEMYTHTEGDKNVTYAKIGNEWTKSEEPAEDGQEGGIENMLDLLDADSGFVLQEKTEKVNDRDAYVLTAQISGSQIDSLVEDLGDITDELGDMNLADMNIDVTLKVYKDDMLPASVSMALTDIAAAEEDDISVEIDSMSVTVNFTEYDSIARIEIPEDVLKTSVEDTDDFIDDIIDDESEEDKNGDYLESLQRIYDKAPEYEHMAIGYYFDGLEEDGIRDGYVPYNENFVQQEVDSLQSANHGISIRLSMTRADSASAALAYLLDDYMDRMADQGVSVGTLSEAETYDNDTVGIQPVYYVAGERRIVTILYADIRDDGSVYMCAEIEADKSSFDDTTADLLAEIDDAYALALSDLFIEE